MSDLADRAIVWWAATDAIGAEGWRALFSLLDAEEKARAKGFHFERDRRCYIAAHGIGRALLAHGAGLDPVAARFDRGAHGKPELRAEPGAPRRRLNLSHTRGLAAALTQEHDIGVDVEWLARECDEERVAARMFAEPERRAVEAAHPREKTRTFLSYWTLKEAYVKAIGKGLAAPLREFAFTLEPLSLGFVNGAGDAGCWALHREEPTPHHTLAVAVGHPAPHRLAIQVEPAPLEAIARLAHSNGPAGSGRI